jgi:hypothetical protein
MIPAMTDERPPTREPGRFYIDELASREVLNRKADTIRKWDQTGRLPNHLKPRRGTRGWRYWTDKQVYGPRGLLWWMEKNDMRPGRMVTDPEKEQQHVENLRRPKAMSAEVVENIRKHAKKIHAGPKAGKHVRTRAWILKHYFPQTRYVSVENFERAVTAYFAERGWDFPPAERRRQARRVVPIPKEIRALERQADRIIKLTDNNKRENASTQA